MSKLIAVAALAEYVAIRPLIIRPEVDESNFIGFVLVHSLLAYFGKINILGLDKQRRENVAKYALAGFLVGYAWMLLYIKYEQRQIPHLFMANAFILIGVLFGAWQERRKLPRSQRRPGGGVNPNRSVPKGFLDPTGRLMGCGSCGSC